jgi:hypothetical protein
MAANPKALEFSVRSEFSVGHVADCALCRRGVAAHDRIREPYSVVLQQRECMDMGHVVYRPNDDLVVAGLGNCSHELLRDFNKPVGDLFNFRTLGFGVKYRARRRFRSMPPSTHRRRLNGRKSCSQPILRVGVQAPFDFVRCNLFRSGVFLFMKQCDFELVRHLDGSVVQGNIVLEDFGNG